MAADSAVTLTEDQKQRYRRLTQTNAVLFATSQRLDDMIAVFNDY